METFNIEEAKKEYISNIKRYISETGSLFPHISVFGLDKKNQKKSIIHIPIPDEFVKSSDKKDEFMDEIFPVIVKELNNRFNTQAIGWASEAWMSTLDSKTNKPLNERKEVLFIMISHEQSENVFVFDIERTGKQINAEGELTDIIELKENTNFDSLDKNPMIGRFANLYQRFKDLS